jgi:hypothetical protein
MHGDSSATGRARVLIDRHPPNADRHVLAAFQADMLLWLRCHVPLCCAFESIAVAGQRRGGGASWKEAMTVARGLHGGFAIVLPNPRNA